MPPAALSTSMSMSSSVLPDASSSSLDDLLTTLEEDIPIGSVGAMRACLSIVSSLFAANVVIAVLLVALQAAGPWGRASGGSDPAGSTVAAFLGFATQWISQVFILVGILGSEIILMMLIERAASR
ncbi:hypothetical protein DFJ73DRAFT_831611 [Zopfochytrium polystomum]|nr:hypothetical protein DFJ73DRAFT_831611 [Zopfochytrium polystomum]